MGAWDYGLFCSDADLDHTGQLSDETGVELWCPENPKDSRDRLDSGILSKTFDRYLEESPLQAYSIVLLGALAMMLGARIESKYLNILRGLYKLTALHDKSKVQFKQGLDTYKNDGTPWDFHCPSVQEVANDPTSDTNMQASSSPGAFHLINVGGLWEPFRAPAPYSPGKNPGYGADAKLPADFDLTGIPRCWNCTKAAEGMDCCASCKVARYCGRECQKKDWKLHKKTCARSEHK